MTDCHYPPTSLQVLSSYLLPLSLYIFLALFFLFFSYSNLLFYQEALLISSLFPSTFILHTPPPPHTVSCPYLVFY